MAIRTHNLLNPIPVLVQDAADEMGLPLVQLPFNVTWPMVIVPLTEEILSERRGTSPLTSPLIEGLLGVLLTGGALHDVAQILADWTRMVVILRNAALETVTLAMPPAERRDESMDVRRLLGAVRAQKRGFLSASRKEVPFSWQFGDRVFYEHAIPVESQARFLGTVSVLGSASTEPVDLRPLRYIARTLAVTAGWFGSVPLLSEDSGRQALRSLLRFNVVDPQMRIA